MYIIRRFIDCVLWGDKMKEGEMDGGCSVDG
jgi:hypothetical protein